VKLPPKLPVVSVIMVLEVETVAPSNVIVIAELAAKPLPLESGISTWEPAAPDVG